jgi:hypothetical protein
MTENPTHARALLRAMPELAGGNGASSGQWAIAKRGLEPRNTHSDYSWSDPPSNTATASSTVDEPSNMIRLFGGLKVFGGVAECSAGALLCTTGLGCVASVVICGHAADTMTSGAFEVWYGKPQQSLTSKGLQAAGLTREQADFGDAVIGLANVGAVGAKAGATVQTIRGAASSPSLAAGVAADQDHIILGLRAFGLEDQAKAIGARHLLADQNWRASLQDAIRNSNTRFTISLDGFSGSGTYSQVMGAVQRGLTNKATATEWELAQLYQSGRLQGASFMRDGKVLQNPFD